MLRFLDGDISSNGNGREIKSVGAIETSHVDVRVISATNQDLKKLVEERKFRADLYYRIKGFSVFIPPLRERNEDILLLINHFSTEDGKKLTTPAKKKLMEYSWPGNIRELKEILQEASIYAEIRGHSRIAFEDIIIPEKTNENELHVLVNELPIGVTLDEASKIFEVEFIKKVLENTRKKEKDNHAAAARVLGISRQGLIGKIKRHNIKSAGRE